ncbi:MAG TPA: hypothetical protein VD963_02605 [Phycisphaerales bacterium]|nr:hypothetical protein [Phycisphaerales bacterium]
MLFEIPVGWLARPRTVPLAWEYCGDGNLLWRVTSTHSRVGDVIAWSVTGVRGIWLQAEDGSSPEALEPVDEDLVPIEPEDNWTGMPGFEGESSMPPASDAKEKGFLRRLAVDENLPAAMLTLPRAWTVTREALAGRPASGITTALGWPMRWLLQDEDRTFGPAPSAGLALTDRPSALRVFWPGLLAEAGLFTLVARGVVAFKPRPDGWPRSRRGAPRA